MGGDMNHGTAFKLPHPLRSPWVLTSLYSFRQLANSADGLNPWGELTIDGTGGLFEPRPRVIFELIPPRFLKL
jgi:hypothetical protein